MSPTQDAKEFWAARARDLVVPLKTEDLFRDYWTKRYLAQLKYLKSGERILDIGCGNARYFVKLSGEFREFYGIDLTEVPFEAARKIFPDGNYVVADEGQLPFKDDFFDAIISWGAFEHNDYIDLTFRECHRVLAPKGVLLFSVPNYVSPAFPYEYKNRRRDIKKLGWATGIGYHYSKQFLRAELEKAGFSQAKFVDSIYAAPIPIVGLAGRLILKAARFIRGKPQTEGLKGGDQDMLAEEALSGLKSFGQNLQCYYNKAFYPLERLGFGWMRVILCYK